MKNRNQNNFFTVLLSCTLTVFFAGCKEDTRIDHYDSDAPPPARVTDVTVHNTAGGAVLKYTVPEDKNLRYVRAEYEIRPGVMRECKASYFVDSLVLEGFGDVRTYDVNIYSVGKNEKTSEPLTVQVNPTTAPVRLATKSLREAFGGVAISIENPAMANLSIELRGDIAQLGYQTSLRTFYSSAEKASFAFRGLDTIQGNFSVYLRDRWNNTSDTVYATLTPWFEEFIPRYTWTVLQTPTDHWQGTGNNNTAFGLQASWQEPPASGNWGLNTDEYPMPWWFSWDMGITIRLSRFKIWHYRGYEWTFGNPKKFELYGSMAPNPDGSLDGSWIPLGKFEAVKPSAGEAVTADDIAFAREGIDFEMEVNEFAPDPFIPVRFIRFVHVESWNGPLAYDKILLHQIQFWGIVIRESE